MKDLSTVISSPLGRENIVFEIWFGTRQVVEISREPNCAVEIEIYPAPENGTWKFDLNEFRILLGKAIVNLKNGPSR